MPFLSDTGFPCKTLRGKKKPLPEGHESIYKIKAGHYLLSRHGQYHRRRGAWLPCSGWERAYPPRHGGRRIDKGKRTRCPEETVIWPSLTAY